MREDFSLKHVDIFKDPEVCKSLKETSVDDRNLKQLRYMSEVKTRVIDFDEVKKHYLKECGLFEDNAKSVDALYYVNDMICMTEFKNGDFTSSEIIEKALSSVLIFLDITKCSLEDFRKKSIFVLVYNPEEKKVEKRQTVAALKARRARKKYSRFDLYHLWDFCFGEVVEIEKDKFDSSIYAAGIKRY